MSAPRMHPTGMVEVVSHAKMEGKVSIYGYGQDDRIPNPGDLLIVTTNWIRENARVQEVEFSLRIRGKQMYLFVEAAREAMMLYTDNAEWLNSPMSLPASRQRPQSTLRSEEQQAAIKSFYGRSQ